MDGEEDIKAGLDLYEMAEILVEMGTWQALVRIHLLARLMVCVLHGHKVMFSLSHTQNLDGGGSSVSVYKGKVISKPTCLDTHFICQRPVTSITCISNV